MTGTQWKRLAQLVVSRRTQLGMKTTKALADRSGLTARALGDVENARRDNYTAGTKAQIENALEWTPGSIGRVLAGGDPTPLSEDAELFLSKLRHPYQANLVAEAIDHDDKDLIAALEEVLETGQVSSNALAQLHRLRDDATIKSFPRTYEVLSRGGKLKVARYGQGVRLEELQQQGGSDAVEIETESSASPEGVKNEEEGSLDESELRAAAVAAAAASIAVAKLHVDGGIDDAK